RSPAPPLAVQVTGPERAVPGEKVVLRLHVTNHQSTAVDKVVVSCKLPEGLSHPQLAPNSRLLEADVKDLGPGQVRSLTLETQVVAAGRQVTEVSARAGGLTVPTGRHTIQVQETSLDMRVEGPRRASVGDEVDFRVVLKAPARSRVDDLRVYQFVPEGLEFLGASTGGTYDPARRTIGWAL